MKQTRLSLKGRALQWLAQREHSRVELRRKLLRQASADPSSADPAGAGAEVDRLLDWLQQHRYLSDERFVESRVHVRAGRVGHLRIRQELAQHGLALPSDLSAELRDSEAARAEAVWQRKFGARPDSSADRARQARFLAGRGFSAEVIARLLRRVDRTPEGACEGAGGDNSV